MNTAIILAAGKSLRFGKDKLFLPILGKPLMYYTLQSLHDHPEMHEIILVTSKKSIPFLKQIIKKYHFPKVKMIIEGGKTRQQSLIKGFQALRPQNEKDVVLIHNGANPLVTTSEISEAITAAKKFGSAAVGHKVVDTIKELQKGHLTKTYNRDDLAAMQTPQAAQFKLLKKALEKAKKLHKEFTDETSLLEFAGFQTRHILASANNFKITTVHDYEKLKMILGDTPKHFLVGIGQDSHEFETTKKGLWLGGIYLAKELKLRANSDGDVILHALCNAISQALGEGSLGTFATPALTEKGIKKSSKYLQHVLKKMEKQRFHLNNFGLMIEAGKPKIDPLSYSIKQSLSKLTGLNVHRIGITATSGEQLTAFGQGKGIQCFAIVSLKKNED